MNCRDPLTPGPGKPDPILSVVIVNFNAWHDVLPLVRSLASGSLTRAGLGEIVVVDNGSDDPPPEEFLPPPRGVRLIERGENGGFAAGVNAGWRASRGRWILLLNPDVVAESALLDQIHERVKQLEATPAGAPGLIGFGLRNPDGSPQPSVGAFPNLGRTILEQLIPRHRRKYQPAWRARAGAVDWVTGACLLVDRRVLEATAGLDEDFFLYYEEVALCEMARREGHRVEYDPSVEVVHLRPLQDRPLTPRMRVITRHSKLLYFRKHLPAWQFLALSAVVAMEARVGRFHAALRGRRDLARSWDAIAFVARTLRRGAPLGGRDVLALADAVDAEETPAKTTGDAVSRPAVRASRG